MNTFSIYKLADGLFTGYLYSGSAEGILDMLRLHPEHGFILGEHDRDSRRVDLETGEVIDYVPPQPGPRYVWDVTSKRWVYTPGEVEALYHAKEAALERVNRDATNHLAGVRAGYPDDEVASWSKQEGEARAWTADNSAPTPFLAALCAARGVPLAYLIGKVIEKADLFASLTGALIGARQRAEDRLDAAATPAEIQQIMDELFPVPVAPV